MPLIACSDDVLETVELSELHKMLLELDDYETKMFDQELEFVNDLYKRVDKYGSGTLISTKQLEWLRRIYRRVVR